jgi:hypothetical protein
MERGENNWNSEDSEDRYEKRLLYTMRDGVRGLAVKI